MAFISKASVRGFRSVQSADLAGLGDLSALVGRNSSGKSNVLRALSLFFSDEVEPGEAFDAQRDFYYRPGSNKKREVRIRVDFDLPPSFNFRKETLEIEQKLGRQFAIERVWSLDQQRSVQVATTAFLASKVVQGGDALAVKFLRMITFRYITNRVQPREVLALESSRLANVLVRRMRQKQGADQFLSALQSTAGRFMKPANEAMKDAGAPIEKMEMSTARALVQVAGLRATGRHGGPVEDEQWGAGHQALGLYEVLRLIDTDYGSDFGWRQAALWLVEEPEGGLHQELQTFLASELVKWAGDATSKHQIVATTHSPIFSMAATSGYWVEMATDGTTGSNLAPSTSWCATLRNATSHPGRSRSFHTRIAQLYSWRVRLMLMCSSTSRT